MFISPQCVDKALLFSFCYNFHQACDRPSLLPPHDILASTNPPLVVDSQVPVSRVYHARRGATAKGGRAGAEFRGTAPAEPRLPGARPTHRGRGEAA